jgi:hypothetical protein
VTVVIPVIKAVPDTCNFDVGIVVPIPKLLKLFK